jgi:ATP synthase protein I
MMSPTSRKGLLAMGRARASESMAKVLRERAAILLCAPDGHSMNGHGNAFGYFALFSEIGLILFVTTMGGLLLGRWLDQQLGTNPVLVISGFTLGIVIGAAADWRLIHRFLEETKP